MTKPEWAIEPEKVQGGGAWHKWRAKGLGGSDAPIIMGVSPWKTPHKLWLHKTGREKDNFKGNPATERGHRLEPVVRARLEKLIGRKFPDDCFDNGIFLASMDGWCIKKEEGLEIKCPGLLDHLTAQMGKVPKKYRWQLIHQFIATGAKVIWYASFYCAPGEDEKKGDLQYFPVKRNLQLCLEYRQKALEFWELVTTDIAPPLTDKDTAVVEGSILTVLTAKYKTQKKVLDLAAAELTLTKEQIIDWAKIHGHNKIECNGVKITKNKSKNGFHYKLLIKGEK